MDWTNFDPDNQSTIHLNLIPPHGRATPLLWKTVSQDTLKGNENNYEKAILLRLRSVIPKDVKVTILADRGFFDIKLFSFLSNELNFDYNIRIRNIAYITDNTEETKKATDWVPKNGQTKTSRNAKITAEKYKVGLVAIKYQKGMKEPWCIVSSDKNQSGSGLIS